GDAVLVRELHDRHRLGTPSVGRTSDDNDVTHLWMRGHRTFDLLGKDFLPAGIDGRRVSPEQLDPAVGQQCRAITRQAVTRSRDRWESASGLRRVTEVSQWHPTLAGEPPGTLTGHELTFEQIVHNRGFLVL